ncbi:phosphotransferase family protein [Paenibacillus thermotolerans]|uniref:phosphotransferase family protein n=1 Tax=Paenibacillus thermotolerans TaxID=3027807 RepID=UPI0023681E78|nr:MULTISPECIES: phosphotransferase [unclassified Paenibacillus]
MNMISKLRWVEKSEQLDKLLISEGRLVFSLMNGGLEAEVSKICDDETGQCYVLKTWNKDSRPDVGRQYKLTEALYHLGIAVPKPLGWGLDENDSQVMLMEFGGSPIQKLSKSTLTTTARLLTAIHRLPPEAFEASPLQKYDFINYFYLGINGHPDLERNLHRLVKQANLKQNRFIHGDYNFNNVLETGEGQYSIIDWTNGQLGDPRYDIGWSVILLRIYAGERYGSMYRSAFLTGDEPAATREELGLFEAIACLRWLLLNRLVGLPKAKNTIPRVKSVLKANAHLPDDLI